MENPLSQLPIPLLGWYQTHARDRAGRTTPQVPTCAGPNLDHLPTAKPPTPVEISTFLSGVPRFTIWT